MVFVGVGVALISIYDASVEGMMGKLGLRGADFANEVKLQPVGGKYLEAARTLKCGLVGRVMGAVKLALSRDGQQGQLAFILGKERIQCGEAMLALHKEEAGTYEVVKGMGYLLQGYGFVEERVGADSRACRGLPGSELDTLMAEIVGGTEGRVGEIVGREWERVGEQRARVELLCPTDVR